MKDLFEYTKGDGLPAFVVISFSICGLLIGYWGAYRGHVKAAAAEEKTKEIQRDLDKRTDALIKMSQKNLELTEENKSLITSPFHSAVYQMVCYI